MSSAAFIAHGTVVTIQGYDSHFSRAGDQSFDGTTGLVERRDLDSDGHYIVRSHVDGQERSIPVSCLVRQVASLEERARRIAEARPRQEQGEQGSRRPRRRHPQHHGWHQPHRPCIHHFNCPQLKKGAHCAFYHTHEELAAAGMLDVENRDLNVSLALRMSPMRDASDVRDARDARDAAFESDGALQGEREDIDEQQD